MKVEIIAIGDEVLLGQTLDTNSHHIAGELARRGWPPHRMQTISDTAEATLEAFRHAFHAADVTLITGGLGPTHDDLTKGLLAEFFDLPMVFRNDLLQQVRQVYERRQLQFLETSREQAEFPEGATAIRNEHGTAPGIWIERDGRIFCAMPGVPYEMKAMLERFVMPRLSEWAEERNEPKTRYRSLLSYGIKEAALVGKIGDASDILQHTKLAYLPALTGVKLRLTVENAKNEREAEGRLDAAETLLRQRVGDYIYATGEEASLEQGVGKRLLAAGKKVAVAESCTAGLLGKMLTDSPGSSAWFERGFITYSNQAKVEMLGLDEDLINRHGAVSAEVAEAMAEGALRNSRAQLAVSITGIAGPDGGTKEKPVGLVHIGLADASQVTSRRFIFDTDRAINRDRSASTALQMLMDYLTDRGDQRGELTLI